MTLRPKGALVRVHALAAVLGVGLAGGDSPRHASRAVMGGPAPLQHLGGPGGHVVVHGDGGHLQNKTIRINLQTKAIQTVQL